MDSVWSTVSLLIRGQLTVLLLLAGWYAIRRPFRRIEWPNGDGLSQSYFKDYGYGHGFGIIFATCLLIALVWLI